MLAGYNNDITKRTRNQYITEIMMSDLTTVNHQTYCILCIVVLVW